MLCISKDFIFYYISCLFLVCNLFTSYQKDIVLFFFICSGFCHTLEWNSHGFTCVPHPNPPSHLPLHPLPLGFPSAPGPSACLMHPTWAGDLLKIKNMEYVGNLGSIPGLGRSPGEGNVYQCKYSGLENSTQSKGSQRVRHDWATFTHSLLTWCNIWMSDFFLPANLWVW